MKSLRALVVMFLSALIVGNTLSTFSNAAEGDTIVFPQKVFVTNEDENAKELPETTFSYEVTSVEEESLLNVYTQEGIRATSGVEGGLILENNTYTISGEVPALAENYELSFDIVLNVDVFAFSNPGIYRYMLSNKTSGDDVIVDLYITRPNRILQLDSYVVYDADNFASDNIVKPASFEYYITLEGEFPVYEERTVIFRFVDEDGRVLADDISVTEEGVVAYTNKKDPQVKGRSVPANDIRSALGLYESTLNFLTTNGYEVVSDEIASHEGDEWFGDYSETVVYTVVLRATSIPTPTPMDTPTPVPSGTPTPTPPELVSTGEVIKNTVYIGIALIAIGGTISAFLVANRKKSHNGGTNESN